MITITIDKSKGAYRLLESKGHAGYSEYGSDIVCAAVSVLLINAVNSIETYTQADIEYSMEEGFLSLRFLGTAGPEATLLMDSLVLGLESIETHYGKKHIHIQIKEV
ncbi:MAG: ribosomal-processing cysteine protease Prp [Lachnospiraceae bacterium]